MHLKGKLAEFLDQFPVFPISSGFCLPPILGCFGILKLHLFLQPCDIAKNCAGFFLISRGQHSWCWLGFVPRIGKCPKTESATDFPLLEILTPSVLFTSAVF